MKPNSKQLGEYLLQHMLDINSGTCSITEEMVMAEEDEVVRDILAGLMVLHQDITFREVQLKEQQAEITTQAERQKELIAELESKVRMIERQKAAINEMSTPVIEVWDGVLCMPIVGVLDSHRSSEMTNTLLAAVSSRRAEAAIVDITGIEVVDTSVADHFIRMAKSVRLLGAECMLTGVSPSIAQTIVRLEIDLEGLTTHRNLREGLRSYVLRARGAELVAAASKAKRPARSRTQSGTHARANGVRTRSAS